MFNRLVQNQICPLESVSPGSGIVRVYDANGVSKEMKGFADPRRLEDLITLECLRAVFGNEIKSATATRDVRFQMEDWGYVIHKRSFRVVESVYDVEEPVDIVLAGDSCKYIQIMDKSRHIPNSRNWSKKLNAAPLRVQLLETSKQLNRVQTLKPLLIGTIKRLRPRRVANSSQSVAHQSLLSSLPREIWDLIMDELSLDMLVTFRLLCRKCEELALNSFSSRIRLTIPPAISSQRRQREKRLPDISQIFMCLGKWRGQLRDIVIRHSELKGLEEDISHATAARSLRLQIAVPNDSWPAFQSFLRRVSTLPNLLILELPYFPSIQPEAQCFAKLESLILSDLLLGPTQIPVMAALRHLHLCFNSSRGVEKHALPCTSYLYAENVPQLESLILQDGQCGDGVSVIKGVAAKVHAVTILNFKFNDFGEFLGSLPGLETFWASKTQSKNNAQAAPILIEALCLSDADTLKPFFQPVLQPSKVRVFLNSVPNEPSVIWRLQKKKVFNRQDENYWTLKADHWEHQREQYWDYPSHIALQDIPIWHRIRVGVVHVMFHLHCAILCRTVSGFVNYSEHRKYVDDVLKEELGPMYVAVPSKHSLEKSQASSRQRKLCLRSARKGIIRCTKKGAAGGAGPKVLKNGMS